MMSSTLILAASWMNHVAKDYLPPCKHNTSNTWQHTVHDIINSYDGDSVLAVSLFDDIQMHS